MKIELDTELETEAALHFLVEEMQQLITNVQDYVRTKRFMHLQSAEKTLASLQESINVLSYVKALEVDKEIEDKFEDEDEQRSQVG